MSTKRGTRLGALAIAVLAMGVTACSSDDDKRTPSPASGTTASALDPFLMQDGEEPGFQQGALPGASPEDKDTITGVDAFVSKLHLTSADATRLRSEGFVSFTVTPIKGPHDTAGVSNVTLYETAAGAQRSMTHDLSPDVIKAGGNLSDLEFFTVPGVPGARGWTAVSAHVANVFWIEGRCWLTLGNQGPGDLTTPLSTGVKAIYARTHGTCP
jgi:hypothetical protein